MKNARHSATINATVGEKMTGFLVVNHYLKGEKFDTLHKYLIESAKNFGIELRLKTNQDMLFEEEKPDFILFWDKDTNLARTLEGKKIKVFNSAKSIELCDDKAKTYIALDGIVAQPKTIIAPLSYFSTDRTDFVEKSAQILGFPLVFKECCGSFGEQVFLCNNVQEVLSHITEKPFLLQEYIETGSTDVRIEVVNGECVASMKRTNKNDFRSNITNGGTAEPYTPTENEKSLALKACKALGLTFGGVDILNGEMVCEVNSNAHIINLKNATGIDIAPMIFKGIIENL